jgi:2,5-diamino-6-(ribosylamino)-4(3H)-pyrimidinone 5'-phosphate reductase
MQLPLMPPKVIINCAMSADGKIALPSRKQTRISSEEDMKRVYELRNASDAVLVGIETVLMDDPKLTVKEEYVAEPKNPLRIVLDSKGRTPKEAHVLDSKAPTLIVTNEDHVREIEGAEVIGCGKDRVDIKKLMLILEKRGIRNLLVEGGEEVIWSFLNEKIADELYIYIGSMIIGGVKSPTPAGGEGVARFEDIIHLTLESVERIGDGVLLKYSVVK